MSEDVKQEPPGLGGGSDGSGGPPSGQGDGHGEDSDEEVDRHRRSYRKSRRKTRDRAGEIKELNITAMMDMMTIILVFLLRSYTASSSTVQMTDALQIPKSSTQGKPQDNIKLTITTKDATVNDKAVASVLNGVFPAGEHDGQDAGNPLIPNLLEALRKEVDRQKTIARFNPDAPFTGKINVICDKRIPYQTVLAALYTAGQAELTQYKLVALKNE